MKVLEAVATSCIIIISSSNVSLCVRVVAVAVVRADHANHTHEGAGGSGNVLQQQQW
jgi:hypothetical protein